MIWRWYAFSLDAMRRSRRSQLTFETGASSRHDDVLAFGDRRGDRLLHQDMHAALDAGERDVAMEVRRRRDRHGIDAASEQFRNRCQCRASQRAADIVRLLAVRIGNAREHDAWKFRKDARMVRTHDADANHPHA